MPKFPKSPELLALVLLLGSAALAWPCRPSEAQTPTADDLNSVLAKMNTNAATFKSAQADVVFETYQRVVDEKDSQMGRVYFRRSRNSMEVAINLTSPTPKQVVFKDNKIVTYEPRIDQLLERDVSNNKAQVEAFLSLGFGAHGDDLKKSYDVTLTGWETIEGVKTAKLELIPKDEKTRNTYNKIILWIDPNRDVQLQQQFFEPSGDYRLTRYSNLKLNAKITDDVFRLKTTGHPKPAHP